MSGLNLRAGPASLAPQDRAVDLMDRLLNDPGDADAERQFGDLFDDIEGDQDFRLGAPGTLATQDSDLTTWIKVMRLFNHKTAGYANLSDQEVINRTIKNASQDAVLFNLQVYLRGAIGLLQPKTAADERPRYASLIHYRNSAIFWIQREMKKRAPSKEDILNTANQTLQRMARKWGVNKQRKVKTYFGRYELAQLIDWDTARSPHMPVTESHHLAWCLALICGVRPGSIGRANFRDDQCLCFREIEITRGLSKGMFNAKVQFLYLKGNRDSLEPEEGLTFSINGAVFSETLPMSVPHRLLVMLLRRQGLKDHDTTESLLQGNDHFIAIKDEVLDQPVCRAAGPRGLSITEEAVSAGSLSSYISDRAMQAGYPSGITMYCWRRKAATAWLRTVGADRARQMMGHELDTRTLEEYYDQGFYDVPVFEIAMRQDTEVARATMEDESSEVLRRMVDSRRLHGAFLKRQIADILLENQEYQSAKQDNDIRAMIRLESRARELATKAFHDERKKVHDRNLTHAEFERRKAALSKPGELVQRIRNVVRNRLRAQRSASSTGTSTPQRQVTARQEVVSQPQEGTRDPSTTRGDRDLEQLAQDRDLEGDDLVDAEDDYATRTEQAVVDVNIDKSVSWDQDTQETQEEFIAAVEAFMLELGKDRFHEPEKLICDLCRNSPYRSQADKDKAWPSKAKLLNHQLGKPHSKQGEIYLKLQYLKDVCGNTKFGCPYGICEGKYTTHEKLVRHIKQSRAPQPDDDLEDDVRESLQRHDDEKRADGWYDDDFEWVAEQKKATVLNANRRRNLGLQYTDERELNEPKEVEIQSSWKMVVGDGGGGFMTEILDHYKGMLAFGDDEEAPCERIPPVSAATATGDDESSEYVHPLREVPAHARSMVALGNEGRPYQHPGLWKDLAETN